MEQKLRDALHNIRYESLTGRGQRGFMPHHIDALVRRLKPFIELEATNAYADGRKEGWRQAQRERAFEGMN